MGDKQKWETNDIYGKCWEKINRVNFVSNENREKALNNSPVPIGENQTTSQPTLISFMVDKLHTLFKNKNTKTSSIKILDIGSGSGVVTALMACLIKNKKNNIVIGIDKYKKLIDDSKKNIKKIDLSTFAKIEFITLDVYELFKNPNIISNRLMKRGDKFDMIYVGAEPKEKKEIDIFKTNIPKFLTTNGIAVAPILGELHMLCKNNCWIPIDLKTRFVPLTAQEGGGLSIEKQKQLIKDERKSRFSLGCKETEIVCKNIAITARSARLYKNHLFPDFKNMKSLEGWCRDKCIIDVGSGVNYLNKNSFISKLTKKRIPIDVVGMDIKKPKTLKQKTYARFIRGNAKTMKKRKLKLSDKCNKNIVLINNVLYLWIDKPAELYKFYKNLFTWLTPGSEIRVFPVYFGRYDMYDNKLKKFIDSKCGVKLLDPKITAESLYEWNTKKQRNSYINKSSLEEEKRINKLMKSKTLVLTYK